MLALCAYPRLHKCPCHRIFICMFFTAFSPGACQVQSQRLPESQSKAGLPRLLFAFQPSSLPPPTDIDPVDEPQHDSSKWQPLSQSPQLWLVASSVRKTNPLPTWMHLQPASSHSRRKTSPGTTREQWIRLP
ncbi:uncharacterized protein K444DRAFT_78719 [Hyaloscypha bicolor E]|uniref:Uncharacterized protein n=1 Tax=Hyaloscypha bicolor E TaxID=1095630 RepID=A0A2J6SYA4_9HELO|nr:uncharacterized protein K444DRAFT_78719 [Hyaloscypha bicolor E]PMD55746.1 hypothetical protein K444DRAFT_78719 [Hyaloscypha bicolor E]